MDGKVSLTGESRVYGKYVIITHYGGYQTLYAHLHRYTVHKGQSIRQGQKIGEMGNSGRSTGPHLHFSIYKNHKPLNPLNFLKRK
jgi:murein DD-endopeptidase MepM/ murein hydrolase activator NlpD